MDYNKYRHEDYADKARLEWLILGCCPIGDRQPGYDSDGFTPCGKWEWRNRHPEYNCPYVPGGHNWHIGSRCSPLWIKRYDIPKREAKGGDNT